MTKKIDPSHPDVQALTGAGLGIERLTQLVNNAAKPIAHEAVSEAQAAEQQVVANATANQQAQSQIPNYIPPLYEQPASSPTFESMLSQIITPQIPQNPTIPFSPIQTGASNG
jgi:hypothetical protein